MSESRTDEISQHWRTDLRQTYERRGLAGRVGFGERAALLIIDMAVAFNDPAYRLGCDQTVAVESIARLAEAMRARRLPIFYVTSAFAPGGSDVGVRLRKIPALVELELGSPAVEIDPRLAPRDGELQLIKKAPSAFFQTGLPALLVAQGVDTVIVTGCSTSGCVRATSCDGASHSYRVIVPVECVSDRAEEPHRANLFDIDAKYGDVMPLAEVLAALGPVAP